jgi:murein tripeptide amidase MpaA
LRVLVIGGIHGDELSSASVALHWILLAQAEPNQTHWRFIPALNPDGLFNQPARRVNANGVDLNRNFPTPNWEREAIAYWEKRTRKDPRRWPGRRCSSSSPTPLW